MTTPLLRNILDQAGNLRAVADYHFGPGREALECAAAFLKSKRQILFSGMGASLFACLPFEYPFKARCIETGELLYFNPSAINDDTALVLVSRSGESIEVKKALDLSSNALGIVNVPNTTLANRAHLAVHMGSASDQLVAIQTYTATLTVLALLHAAIIGELDQAKAELNTTVEALKSVLPTWVDQRESWHPFLSSTAPLYYLGRGSTLGAVTEGVLLMHETAKAPAVGMSVPQFRHGPVEVVDADFHAVIIGTQPATAYLDFALANDILKMGGHVRWLGPSAAACHAEPLCQWPANIPARFQSIFETIPLQIIAYTKAELRGLRPGDFRWATAITTSEAGF